MWQIAEFILGGLDEEKLEAVCRHFDECADCLEWLAGVIRVAVRVNAGRGSGEIKVKENMGGGASRVKELGGLY